MQCPHCTVNIHEDYKFNFLGGLESYISDKEMAISSGHMFCPSCSRAIVILNIKDESTENGADDWTLVYPKQIAFNVAPIEVPNEIRDDYAEACAVLPFSPKASAAILRRVLQSILVEQGYDGRDLAKQIDKLLTETDPARVLPSTLHQTVDAIRNFGNFSAHPITDLTTLQIIDIEPEEAEWCLEIIRELFDHFYVNPARMRLRKIELDKKLKAANKPPSK